MAELQAHVQAVRVHAAAAFMLAPVCTDACCSGLLRVYDALRDELHAAIDGPYVSRSNAVIARIHPDLDDFVNHLRTRDELT